VTRRATDVSRSDPRTLPPGPASAFDGSEPVAIGSRGPRVDSASRLLEVEDVADYLGMRTDWVYREVRAGRLPHIRLGRAVRFRRESIEA
jgi:excisionase family DNA binding protein